MRLLLQLMVLALAVRLAVFALIALVIVLLITRPAATLSVFGLLLWFGLLQASPVVGLALIGAGVWLAWRAEEP